MNPSDYQKLASRTIVDLGSDSFRKHLENSAIGMSVEANEVLQHIQRFNFCNKDIDKDHLLDECGDVLWYVSYLLTTIRYSLDECMEHNVCKIKGRYPHRFYSKEG